ncbi:MAG: SOUL family heme-binding protein [Gammaproteobacteria bacterium]
MKQQASKTLTRHSLFATVLLLAGGNAMSLEKPEYTVVYKEGDVEYRQYEPYLVAETVISNSDNYKDAGNEGFRRLFRYITGNNSSSSEVAMTAPVQQTPQSEKIAMTAPVQSSESASGWTVAFMLPTKYTLDSAPVPLDERIQVRRVPGRTMAVIRYSGRWTESNYAKRSKQLMKTLEKKDVTAISEFESALYNAPYVPPFMRRNEVMVQVDVLPAEARIASTESGSQQAAW